MICHQEIQHLYHWHNLELQHSKTEYTCDGCKERGWGTRYRCEECNYDLHKSCALVTPTMFHSFYQNCFFEFHENAKGQRYCNACGKDVLGFAYHCSETGYDLHPCCATLPRVLQGDNVELHLCESLLTSCGKCRGKELFGKIKGWSYKSTGKGHHFHVSCVKEMVIEAEMNNFTMEITKVPNLRVGGKAKGKARCWKIVKIILKFAISIAIGDAAGIANLIGH
ncbi:hypothetical protein ACHQM5_021386 [Ranunculus cassubicifolius]